MQIANRVFLKRELQLHRIMYLAVYVPLWHIRTREEVMNSYL